MRGYIEYVLACRSKQIVPMGKQDWMQLGMPDSPTDSAHVAWLQSEQNNAKEFNERAELYERIEKKG